MAGDPPAGAAIRPWLDDRDLTRIAAGFELGDVLDVAYLPAGTMNHNWRLTTVTGDVAVKLLRDVSPADARRNAGVLRPLRRQLPVHAPLRTSSGDTVCEVDDRAYVAFPWIPGRHLTGPDLTLNQVSDLGVLVGRLHRALTDPATGLPPAPPAPPDQPACPAAAIAEARRFQQASYAAGSQFDRAVAAALAERIALIGAHAPSRPTEASPCGLYGWTHGDVQPGNVLWRDGRVVAVIDWDRLRPRPYALEVVRTATIQFATSGGSLDLQRIAAFTRGYRTVVELDDADITDGVHRLWWTNLTSCWHLAFHYDQQDGSCDGLFLPGERILQWWTDHYSQVTAAFTATGP